MKKMLVTGGAVFVSRYIAEYYVAHGYEVYVLNRNRKRQSRGVRLIEDISDLLDGLGSFDEYIMISSSAVYPETELQPFKEESGLSENKFWGKYGTDKIAAEEVLLSSWKRGCGMPMNGTLPIKRKSEQSHIFSILINI